MVRRGDLIALVREDRQGYLFPWVVVSQKLYPESQGVWWFPLALDKHSSVLINMAP